MKTRKLNFDDFKVNQLTSIQQKSINGGLGPDGEIPPFEGGDDWGDGEPESGVPPNQQTVPPMGNIRVGEGDPIPVRP